MHDADEENLHVRSASLDRVALDVHRRRIAQSLCTFKKIAY